MPQSFFPHCKLSLNVIVIIFLSSPWLTLTTANPPTNKTAQKDITKYPLLIPKEIVTTESSSLVRSYEEELQAQQPGGIRPARGRIHSAEVFLKNCGDLREKCRDDTITGIGGAAVDQFGDADFDTTTTPTTTTRRSRKIHMSRPKDINYQNQPFYCRCDEDTCDEYGDCCWTIAKTLLYENSWRCNKVQDENVWALMVSKCSADDPTSPFLMACEAPENIPYKQRLYLHDIPVYAKRPNGKGTLFRNIYCAECNGVSNNEISRMTMRLRCSHNFTQEELGVFMKSAVYKLGSRLWEEVGGDRTCSIYIPKLDSNSKAPLHWEFPEIRYCRKNTIEDCPKSYADANPLDAALCSSYTQTVYDRERKVFKNPHCARCNGVSDYKMSLNCQYESEPAIQTKISPHQAGANLGSAGQSILFDFGFDNYVGYETKCPENMMWNYLYQNCTLTTCHKGHHLDPHEGSCVPDDEDYSQTEEPALINSTIPKNSRFLEPKNKNLNNYFKLSCYAIFVHEDEYHLLPNLSIIINQTLEEGKSFKTLMFHPGQYSKWNETTITICAQELHKGFTPRFSTTLNYISMAALAISVFFSSLHILLFVFIPKMRNLPGKNLFCLTFSLLVSQGIFLAFIGHKADGVCVSAAILMHYFFLTSFFWMNIMSFDVWRTFSGEFMQRRPGNSTGKTFIKYSLYAWVIPGFIVITATILDLWAAEEFKNGENSDILKKLRPLYGHNNICWITQGLPLLIFFALPVVILISVNMILFLVTAKAIHDQNNDSQKVFKGKESNTGDNSRKDGEEIDRMKLYTKLGIIMGIGFILGFLSEVPGCEWLWYPFVIVNGLQGTFIFFAFDWKLTVWKLLKEQGLCLARFRKETRDYGIASRRDTTSSSTVTTSVGPTLKSFHGKPDT